MKSILSIAENYPKLQANENFKMLQEELAGTESKIAFARQFYNDNVMALNNKIQQFQSSTIANILKFKEREFFKSAESEKKPVKVEF